MALFYLRQLFFNLQGDSLSGSLDPQGYPVFVCTELHRDTDYYKQYNLFLDWRR